MKLFRRTGRGRIPPAVGSLPDPSRLAGPWKSIRRASESAFKHREAPLKCPAASPRGTIPQSDCTVCKVFAVGPFLSPLLPLGTAALLRRGAEPGAVSPGGLRGLRGRARDRSGAGEGAQKLVPNQRGVQLLSTNLQVTPRGGGRSSGGGGGDQRPQ